jgi:GNAT superfamily N-acetyltransferase
VTGKFTAPQPLTAGHDIAAFRCGEDSLDEWLHRFALANQASGSARTFVACLDDRVAGYYALATAAVSKASAPARVAKAMPEPIPVLLLARLAVDQTVQGHGLGWRLLRDAILRTLQVAEHVGVRALLAHALDQRAAGFYARHDFQPSPTDPLHMLLLLKDARALIRTAAPDQPQT